MFKHSSVAKYGVTSTGSSPDQRRTNAGATPGGGLFNMFNKGCE